jgi:ATP-dependent Clp protease, protease subunit
MDSLLVDGELYLHGIVGDTFWGDGFTSQHVIAALAEHGRDHDLKVHINSGGGVATEGAAIYALLSSHRGYKTVYVEGIAASAASLIAMAGDEIVMRDGSIMMIHDPAGFTMGNSKEHAKQIESLEALATTYADVYATRAGIEIDEARQHMVDEVWLKPEDAVSMGYADRVERGKVAEPVAFAYHLYKHAPDFVLQHDQPEPDRRKKPARKKAERAALPRMMAQKEPQMADEPKSGDQTPAVDVAKISVDIANRMEAILDCDEAKGREALARRFAFKTTMAVDDVKAFLAAAPKEEPKAPAPAPVVTPSAPQGQVDRGFEVAMQRMGNPVIGPDAPALMTEAEEAAAMAKAAIELYRGATKGVA